MPKLSLSDITSGYAAPANINANNALIEAAIENTLSRDGTTPNQMESSLDMNSNRVLNLPAPLNAAEPVRLSDLSDSDATGAASATLRAELAAPSGSSLVGFLQAGTGAVALTAQAKLRETVSAKDFGAVGDGVTNDAAAIQAAINAVSAANGGIVRVPTGVYNIGAASPAITIPDNVSLVGEQSSYRPATGEAVEFVYSGVGTAFECQGMFIECSNFSVRATAPSGVNLVGVLHDGGWFCKYSRLTFKNFPTANGYAFKMTSGPVSYGTYACSVEQIDAASSALAFFGRNSGDGITTLTLKDVHGERMTLTCAQILILNGSFTVTSGTAIYMAPFSILNMVGVDIEGSGAAGIALEDSTCQLFEFGTLWGGWSGTERVVNNGVIESRAYGAFSSQQTLSVNVPALWNKLGAQAQSNGLLAAFVSDYVTPTDLVGGSQSAYRQWRSYANGVEVVDHDWELHAFIKKAISTASVSTVTLATIPVTNGSGLKLSAHAAGSQVGDTVYSNSRGCNVINAGGVLTIVQDTQITCGSGGAIAFVASGQNVLVQWTPTTANASTGTMNIDIRGLFTGYS